MSSEARKESTVGEIVNLMAVDAQRVQDVFSYIWILWSAPLQIAICLWQLYDVIGASLFAGFAIMILMMPLNGFVAVKQRNLQVQQMKLKDDRIKIMNEVLSGIKVRSASAHVIEYMLETVFCVLSKNFTFRCQEP